jgi:hypothetical protein
MPYPRVKLSDEQLKALNESLSAAQNTSAACKSGALNELGAPMNDMSRSSAADESLDALQFFIDTLSLGDTNG